MCAHRRAARRGGERRRARRARRTSAVDLRRQGRLRHLHHPGQQGLAHARRRRADRGLLPRPRHAGRPRPAVRRQRRQVVRRPRAATTRATRSSSPTGAASPTARSTPTGPAATGSPRPTRRTRRAPSLLVRVHFESLTRKPLRLYALYDPALSDNGDDDSGSTRPARAAGIRRQGGQRTGRLAGVHEDLQRLPRRERRLDRPARGPSDGLELRLGARRQRRADRPTELTGRRGSRDATLALGFGARPRARRGAPRTPRCAAATARRRARYRAGWHRYLGGLRAPAQRRAPQGLYDVSLMVLAASEDKTYRGAVSRRRRMAWVWGTSPATTGPTTSSGRATSTRSPPPSSRPATAPRRGARSTTCGRASSSPTAASRRTRTSTARRTGRASSSTRSPTRSCSPWQLGRTDAGDLEPRPGGPRSASSRNGPATQERWENATGYSPASIGAEIAGLVCAARDRARQRRAADDAARYRSTADALALAARQVDRHDQRPAVEVAVLPAAQRGRRRQRRAPPYTIADGGPTVDQRTVVDPSFLELVRLGVRRADDADIALDAPRRRPRARRDTPNGQFWHRYNHDGYGETPTAAPFARPGNIGRPVADLRRRARRVRARRRPAAREVAAARSAATKRLDAIANTANDGLMLPEQVWDDNPPSGTRASRPGDGHVLRDAARLDARAVHPARLVDRRRPAGRAPRLVSCRYGGPC